MGLIWSFCRSELVQSRASSSVDHGAIVSLLCLSTLIDHPFTVPLPLVIEEEDLSIELSVIYLCIEVLSVLLNIGLPICVPIYHIKFFLD